MRLSGDWKKVDRRERKNEENNDPQQKNGETNARNEPREMRVFEMWSWNGVELHLIIKAFLSQRNDIGQE